MKLTIVVFSGCLLACGSAAAQIVKMDGSSTVYPISEAVAEDFQKAKKNAVKVTVGEMKRIWEPSAQGKVTKWNQVNAAWPDAPIKLFGPGADSGTFDYFTEAVVGKSKSSRGDYTASEDDNVLVQGVSRDANALGYFGFAYYVENKDKLRAVPIVEKTGKPAVEPSFDNVVKGIYQPLARPIFIYVSVKALDLPEVREFAEYYMKNGAKLSKEVKYVPPAVTGSRSTSMAPTTLPAQSPSSPALSATWPATQSTTHPQAAR